MKNRYFFISIMLFSKLLYCQVGINTTIPKASLDVVGTASNSSISDGIIAPRLTGNELKSKDLVYTTDQTGTLVYVTSPASPTSLKTINVTTEGYYYFNGVVWNLLSPIKNMFGDIKSSFKNSDHDGWIKLDGRSISSLSTTQQSVSNSLGFTVNLPNRQAVN